MSGETTEETNKAKTGKAIRVDDEASQATVRLGAASAPLQAEVAADRTLRIAPAPAVFATPAVSGFDPVYVPGQVLVLNNEEYAVEQHINKIKASGEAYVYLARRGLEQWVIKHYKGGVKMPVDVLTRLKSHPHPRIVALRDFGTNDGHDFEIMAYAKGESLDKYLLTNGGIRSLPELKRIAGQINEGLEFLHSTAGIIYQDLKPDNLFFVDKQNQDIVLADFGISSCLQSGSTEAIVRADGTEEFAAPELARKMHQQQVMVSKAVDYFAFGVTLFHLWLGKNPFDDIGAQQRDYMILQQSLVFPEDMDKELVLLLKGLLHPLAKDRWTSEHVKKWVAGESLEDSIILVQKPFKRLTFIGNEEFETRQELAALLEKYPQQGIDYLYEGGRVIEKWVQDANNIQLLTSIQKVINRYGNNQALGLYQVILTLDPSRPFVTEAGTVCANNYELGNALEAEAAFYAKELTDRKAKLFIYIESVGGDELADRFRGYFSDATPASALNRLVIELQGGKKRLLLSGARFESVEALSACTDTKIREEIIRQLHIEDSKLLCWLEGQGALTDSRVPTKDGVALFSVLLCFPWLKAQDLLSADELANRIGDYAFDIINAGRSDLLEQYLAAGYSLNVNAQDDTHLGFTPLTLAAYLGDPAMIEYLLEHGADLNRTSNDGSTPLVLAILNGRFEAAKVLLEHGANPNDTWNGETALDLSITAGVDGKTVPYATSASLAFTKLLIVNHANPNQENKNGETALWTMLRYSGDIEESVEVFDLLIRAGAHVNHSDPNGMSLFRQAVLTYRDRSDKGVLLTFIELMLQHGANPNQLNQNGNWSPLMIAAHAGDDPVVSLLLSYGAKKTLADQSLKIAFVYAKSQGHTSTTELVRPGFAFGLTNTLFRVGLVLAKIAVIALLFFSFDCLARVINRTGLEPLPLGVLAYVLSLIFETYVLIVLSGTFQQFWYKFGWTLKAPKGLFFYFILIPVLFTPAVALLYGGLGLLPIGASIISAGTWFWTLVAAIPVAPVVVLVYLAVLGAVLVGINALTNVQLIANRSYGEYRKSL